MTRLALVLTLAGLLGGMDQVPLIANQGLDIPKDEIASKKIEALSGSGIAAFQLYNYYDVVLLNRGESLYWVTISAENDYPSGMYALGFRLAGLNDTQSRTRARYWLEKAEKNGEPLARDILKQLETPSSGKK